MCPNCRSEEGKISILGPTRCTMCDGTEIGTPPIADLLVALEDGFDSAVIVAMFLLPGCSKDEGRRIVYKMVELVDPEPKTQIYKGYALRVGYYKDWWIDDPNGKHVSWAKTLDQAKTIVDGLVKS